MGNQLLCLCVHVCLRRQLAGVCHDNITGNKSLHSPNLPQESIGGVTVSIAAFQAVDPGSTPGQCTLFFFFLSWMSQCISQVNSFVFCSLSLCMLVTSPHPHTSHPHTSHAHKHTPHSHTHHTHTTLTHRHKRPIHLSAPFWMCSRAWLAVKEERRVMKLSTNWQRTSSTGSLRN